ncbi:hypothetical protein J4Q44_G00073230 [Coregonus suidteri]|uniref:Uncharacterized protein n=1 Tax=Coregonus suidteri TaxID=861788 RepID=A0AAN8N821_9TELE
MGKGLLRRGGLCQDVVEDGGVGGLYVAEGGGCQFALNGADGRRWRRGPMGVVVGHRLRAGLNWLYGLPWSLHWLGWGGGHSGVRLGMRPCTRLRLRLWRSMELYMRL